MCRLEMGCAQVIEGKNPRGGPAINKCGAGVNQLGSEQNKIERFEVAVFGKVS